MKVVIVDDEPKAREVLKKLLLLSDVEIDQISEASGVNEAEQLIKSLEDEIDVLFLDVKMQDGTGFDLLKRIQPISFNLIFTTAYDEFALKAIKESAIDYLLKPVEIDELESALEKAKQNCKNKKTVDTSDINSKFLFPKKSGLKVLTPNDILYIEGDGSYSRIVLKDNTSFQSTKIIKEFEELLPEAYFHRIHKSFLVNIECVIEINKNNEVTLTNNEKIELSRRKKQEFLNKFKKV